MKKICLMLFVTIILSGCSGEVEHKEKSRLSTIYNGYSLSVNVDNNTCVEYLEGYHSGVSVMYNADGTIRLNEECINRR